MKLIDKFNKYKSLHSEILEEFGTEGHEMIEDNLDSRWIKGDLEWIQWLDTYGVEYGYEYAQQCGEEVDGYVLFYIQENGEKFFSIFSSSLRYDNQEEFEKQMNVKI